MLFCQVPTVATSKDVVCRREWRVYTWAQQDVWVIIICYHLRLYALSAGRRKWGVSAGGNVASCAWQMKILVSL